MFESFLLLKLFFLILNSKTIPSYLTFLEYFKKSEDKF